MTGTVWHIERYERQDGDERRHRSRCVNYKGKPDNYCTLYHERCRGSAHCDHYKEREIKQGKVEHKRTNPDECRKATSTEKKAIGAVAFKGIKNVILSEIVVDRRFARTPIQDAQVNHIIAYFKKHGELDQPIVVSVEEGKYKLQDKYNRFLAAKKLGLKTVPVEMGTKEEIRERDEIRKIGTMVWQQKHAEVGQVVASSLSRVTVRYHDGKERIYDIYKALETKNLRRI